MFPPTVQLLHKLPLSSYVPSNCTGTAQTVTAQTVIAQTPHIIPTFPPTVQVMYKLPASFLLSLPLYR